MNLNNEQLRFFYDEVLGLFDWGDEEEEMGLDPLNFVRERIKDERKWAKMTAKKYAEIERELTKIRAEGSLVKLKPLRVCPACKSILEETSVYCDNCGTDTPKG